MSRTPRLSRKFSKPTLSRQINGDISTPNQPTEPTKTRLDHYLVEKYPDLNRSTLQKLIKDGSVSVDGETITKPSTLVSEADEIIMEAKSDFSERVFFPVKKSGCPSSEKLSERSESFSELDDKRTFLLGRTKGGSEKSGLAPSVIYDDANVLVLDKPSGMLSMSKGQYNPEPTLEDYGLIAHRLDRGTSGVIILAKNEATKSSLQKQFQQRKVKKTYYAVVSGHPTQTKAIINIPLTRNLSRPSTFQPDANGREAITEYEVVDQNDQYSLLKLTPTTGRTHQIRVHLAHIGHPILGDTTYGGPEATRVYLHAAQLEITLPGGVRKTFTSPIPQEFSDVLRQS